MRDQVSRVPVRKPFASERDFFLQHELSRGNRGAPSIEGMATSDNRAILIPFSLLPPKQRAMVQRNEQIRVALRTNKIDPTFALTEEQMRRFKSYGSKQDIRHTIIARALTSDMSAGNLTKEQISVMEKVKRQLGIQAE